jgi:hypothetical protein
MNRVAFRPAFHSGFIPDGVMIPAKSYTDDVSEGNPMARDSQAALVALNRFGFGARGGASGDFVNAAKACCTTSSASPNACWRRRYFPTARR